MHTICSCLVPRRCGEIPLHRLYSDADHSQGAEGSVAPERRLDSRWGSTGIAALPIVCLALLTSTVVVDAQFSYSVEEGAVTITGYTGIGGVVIIPDTIEGLPVTGIEDRAFFNEESLTSVVIPASITHIGTAPLPFCPGLVGISVSTENTYFASEDGVLFNKNKSAKPRATRPPPTRASR